MLQTIGAPSLEELIKKTVPPSIRMERPLKHLGTRPGTTAKEYVDGRRKAYFNPFTFFLLIMGLFVFLNITFNPPKRKFQADATVLNRMPNEPARQNYISTMKRVEWVTNFTTKNGNLLAMIAIPYISAITWLFYRRHRFNYAEHLTANMMFITFSNLLFALLVFPLQAATRNSSAGGLILFVGMLLQVFYLWWCLNGFLELRTAGSRARSLLVSLLAIFLWTLLTMLAMAIYIYQSWNFYKFFTRFAG